jgi:outer membrane biosynthesis protein TonB
MRPGVRNEVDELLDELDQNLKRLRMEYEQFFQGAMKREPQVLRAKVQKVITRMVNEPPRNARQKFRFNSLNAKFQVYRQLWGRTMRQIETGTYKRDRFKAKVRAATGEPPASEPRQPAAKSSSMDRLHDALVQARQQTGEAGSAPSSEALSRVVTQQMAAIRSKHGDVKVKFKVVIEGNKAKLKALLSK